MNGNNDTFLIVGAALFVMIAGILLAVVIGGHHMPNLAVGG